MLRKGTKESYESLNLLRQVFLTKDDLSKVELGEDATCRPEVNLRRIILRLILEKQLRGTEPSSNDIWSEVIGCIDAFILDCSEAEIADPQLTLVVHK